MRRSPIHALIAWTCLLWFGVLHSALAAGMVVCRDGNGGASMEWGCERDVQGKCLSASPGEDDPAAPEPCQDQPIAADQALARAATVLASEVIALPCVMACPITGWPEPVASIQVPRAREGPHRPPDSLGFIRTFVLIV